MSKTNPRLAARVGRQERVRKKVRGVASRPRLCVFRSASHIYAQLIDDVAGRTLAAFSTLNPSIKEELKGLNKTEKARRIGKAIGAAILALGLKDIIFDRNGFLYHGRVKALSEGAREAGLNF
ncbi:MAG: 50S ribosomal protein L18 [Deltaproteobacteria bacterium]|jgi:large subunit ribosomal protein L18|nr:50S ribosomal protein L18 [Deltaproteobacteria bacterium]